MSYRHLTLEQRYQIAALHRAGFPQKEIAESIGCHPNTVCRELRQNGPTKAMSARSQIAKPNNDVTPPAPAHICLNPCAWI